MLPMNFRTARDCRRRRRSGVATIELVMCAPILLALAVMAFVLANASSKKSQVAIGARYEAWADRDSTHEAAPLRIPNLSRNPISKTETEPARLPAWSMVNGSGRTELTAVSKNHLLADSWDSDNPAVGFADSAAGLRPHRKPLTALLAGGASGVLEVAGLFGNLPGALLERGLMNLAGAGSGLGNLGSIGGLVEKAISQQVQVPLIDKVLEPLKIDQLLGGDLDTLTGLGNAPTVAGGSDPLTPLSQALNGPVRAAGDILSGVGDFLDVLEGIADTVGDITSELADAADTFLDGIGLGKSELGKLTDELKKVTDGIDEALKEFAKGQNSFELLSRASRGKE